MNHLFVAVVLIASACTALSDSLVQPDWSRRYEEIKAAEVAFFVPPAVGSSVTIERRIGGNIRGTISAITADTIRLGSTTYRSDQLTPRACAELFPVHYASGVAMRRVAEEREEFTARQQVQQLARQQDLQRRESARREREELERRLRGEREAVQIRAEEQERQRRQAEQLALRREQERQENERRAEATRIRIDRQAEQRLAKTKSVSRKDLVDRVLGGALGFLVLSVYLLPSFVAASRKHHNHRAICVLNIFLGWTFAGWVISLVWAMTRVEQGTNR